MANNKLWRESTRTTELVFLLAMCSGFALAGPVTYTAIDIGSLGGNASTGQAINNSGQVTGSSWLIPGDEDSPIEAFLYSNGTMSALGSVFYISTGFQSAGYAINASGEVTGISLDQAFLYSDGVMKDLGTLGGGSSQGNGINSSGEIAGTSQTSSGASHAFLYSNGVMHDLGTLGGTDSLGWGINSSGEIAGWADTVAGTAHAFLYSNGVMHDLGTLGGTDSYGFSVNDSGEVAGWSSTAGDTAQRAFLYSDGTMKDLGALGMFGSYATAINNSGEVVGWSEMTANYVSHAFLYTDGAMYDLNSLVTSGLPSSTYIDTAYGINENGWIIADADDGMAYILEPVPEPSSLPLLTLGSGLLVAFALWRTFHRPRKTAPWVTAS